jgi:general secretion pathway protein K
MTHPTAVPRANPASEDGFALIAVLLVLAMLGVIGAEFAYSMRLEASAVRAMKEGIAATHLAEAAVEQAIREIAADTAYVALTDDGQITFFTRDRLPVPRLPRNRVSLGAGQFSYRITDEEARLNLNTAPPDRVDRLLQALGISKLDRDVINDSLQDWRDPNEEHRLNGAESEDYYLKLEVPYRSRNANLESLTELLQIRGVTPALVYGTEGHPGLADLVTVKSPGTVNLNTTSPEVLRAMGLADAEIIQIVQGRRDGPYAAIPGQFGGRGLSVTSRTFRIEAEGFVEGQRRASLTAVVQTRAQSTAGVVAVLEWLPDL